MQVTIPEGKKKCERCGRVLDVDKKFYKVNDENKSPCDLCKECLTAHVDNFKPDTFMWILEKLNIPYVQVEWNLIRDRAFQKNPKKMTGMTVLGRYLSKMKLTQWRDKETGQPYVWADTERLNHKTEEKDEAFAEEVKKIEEQAKKDFEEGKISEAEYKTLTTPVEQYNTMMTAPPPDMSEAIGLNNMYNESKFIDPSLLPDLAAELTQEDKIRMAMKWGTLYTPNEWIELEKKYSEFEYSFDIQDADTRSALILICKTYLKLNSALDSGDMDSYNKLSRVYDQLRKSTKFTAAQNKEKGSEMMDSLGEFIALCEKEEGFIPRYCTDVPQDKVDVILKDNQTYLYNLVKGDLGFGDKLDLYIKKIELQKEQEASYDALEDPDQITEFTDEDMLAFNNAIEEGHKLDEQLLNGEIGEEA